MIKRVGPPRAGPFFNKIIYLCVTNKKNERLVYESSVLPKKTFLIWLSVSATVADMVCTLLCFQSDHGRDCEKMPYYAYDLLKAEQKKRITTQGWEKGIPRINRLLFRLVNKSATSHYHRSRPALGSLFIFTVSQTFCRVSFLLLTYQSSFWMPILR